MNIETVSNSTRASVE